MDKSASEVNDILRSELENFVGRGSRSLPETAESAAERS